jgi:hypothetical protein
MSPGYLVERASTVHAVTATMVVYKRASFLHHLCDNLIFDIKIDEDSKKIFFYRPRGTSSKSCLLKHTILSLPQTM